ncbi:DUF3379 family protein [Neptunicella sp. SCSIO 80796]|uniref:DUF3379 family protein n=1 Tax=Neptunicella plasticusilytica TaxID=3117012 RepID=UPI003A4DC8D4
MKDEVAKMDELEFRRTIYADPDNTDAEMIAAAQQDKAKQHFWQDVKQLDKQIKQTVNQVDIPDGLAHRLILRQSIARHRKQQVKQRWYIALAASVAFLLGINFTLLQNNTLDLTHYALAHRYHEGEIPMQMDENVSLQQLNVKLASMGAHLQNDIGKVYFANFCDFEQVRSLHMVIDSGQGKITVFVVPHDEKFKMDAQFADQRFNGKSIDLGEVALIVLGEKNQPLQDVTNKLSKQLVFSA